MISGVFFRSNGVESNKISFGNAGKMKKERSLNEIENNIVTKTSC
jgi:hypothetical protein